MSRRSLSVIRPALALVAGFLSLVLAGSGQAKPLAIQQDKAVIELHVALSLNGLDKRSSASGTIVSSLEEGADSALQLADYTVTLLVMENTGTEFTFRISFTDSNEEFKGAESVTVTIDRGAIFDLRVDTAVVEGVVEVINAYPSFEAYSKRDL